MGTAPHSLADNRSAVNSQLSVSIDHSSEISGHSDERQTIQDER
jgi:hypothetical protein